MTNILKEFDKQFSILYYRRYVGNDFTGGSLEEFSCTTSVKGFILKALAEQKKETLKQVREIAESVAFTPINSNIGNIIRTKNLYRELNKLK